MYCLQWLIPILLIPKPVNPALLYNHVMFMGKYTNLYKITMNIKSPILLVKVSWQKLVDKMKISFLVLYLFGFFIERKPCTICSLVFVFAVILICSTGNLIFRILSWFNNIVILSLSKSNLMRFGSTVIIFLGDGNSCIFWNNICNKGDDHNDGKLIVIM